MLLASSACVPTTMSVWPFFSSSRTCVSSFEATSREACAIFTGKPRKRSVKVWKCCRARSVVGTTTATCFPSITARKAARKRHFRLAEADVAADEPVHRPALGEVFGDRVDARELIVGLLIREARDELVIGPIRHAEDRRRPCLARSRNLDQLLRHLADALLHAGLASLPGRAAELVEIRVRLVGAVARQKLHVLDGQEELVAARIFEFHAVVRSACRRDGLEADEPADAVIGMHHEIARREARRLHQHVARLLRLPAADEPVAENILLGDDREVRRLEAAFEAEQRKAHSRFIGLSRLGDIRNLLDAGAAMRRDHVAEPLAGAVGPAGHDGAFPEPLKRADMLDDGRDQLLG